MVGKPKKPYHSVIWWQWPLFHCSYLAWICGDILLRNNMSNKITFSANKLHVLAFNFNLAFVSLSRAFPIRFCNIFANVLPVTIMTFKKTKHMSHCKSANTFFMRRSNFVGTQFRQKSTTLILYRDGFVANAVLGFPTLFISTCQYPEKRSMLRTELTQTTDIFDSSILGKEYATWTLKLLRRL